MSDDVKKKGRRSTQYVLDEAIKELRVPLTDLHPKPTYDLRSEWEQILNKYPMLELVDRLHGWLDKQEYPKLVQYINDMDRLAQKN